MDIEFHYYMTYLIAARAGFSPGEASQIAHSAQGVDDNHIKYEVHGAESGPYENYISQTLDILKPASQLLRIYPIFHFIPGEPDNPTAARKDGATDPWVTTPNSPVAQKMIDSALASGNLYRIGVSAHGYVDTWAHQNFIGRHDAYNHLPGGIGWLAVGHGLAGHQPDQPALVWTDPRMIAERIDNRSRFLDAAEHLYRRFAEHVQPGLAADVVDSAARSLRADLSEDIGPEDPKGRADTKQARIARYRARALTPAYGAAAIPAYNPFGWFNAAVNEQGAHLRQAINEGLNMAADFLDQLQRAPCSWRDPSGYQSTDWYQFVEAVKAHQNACWDILVEERLPHLDMPGM